MLVLTNQGLTHHGRQMPRAKTLCCHMLLYGEGDAHLEAYEMRDCYARATQLDHSLTQPWIMFHLILRQHCDTALTHREL